MSKIALLISILLVPPPPPSSGPPPAPDEPEAVSERETAEPEAAPAEEADSLPDIAEPEPEPEPEPLVPRASNEPVELDFDPYGLEKDRVRPNAGRGVQIAGASIVGVGLVLGVIALVYLSRTNKARTRLGNALDDPDPEARVQPIADVESNRTMSRIFGLASLGTVTVGTIVFAVGMRRARNKRHVQAALPRPHLSERGAGLSWQGRF